MAPKCPTTEKSWGRKSAAKGCSPKGNYHCVQTQDGDVIELCTSPIWIEAGKCPVYNRARILDSKLCQPRVLQTTCPPNVYRSNQVFKYTACFPENSISTTSTQTSTLIGKQTIILNTTTIPTADNTGTGLELLALLILIPFMLALLVVLYLQRRGYIKIHRLCTSNKQRSKKRTALKSSADKGHCSIDIGENKEESEKFLYVDNHADEQCNSQCTSAEHKDSLPICSFTPTENHASSIKVQPSTMRLSSEVSRTKTGNHTSNIEMKPSKEGIKSSSEVRKKNSRETGRHSNIGIEPNLSMVINNGEKLSKRDILIITGLPGSGKSTLAQRISQAACNCVHGANLRFIKKFEDLNKMFSEQETFLILDDCIQSWLNDTCVHLVFESLSKILQNRKSKVHVLLCAPPQIWDKFSKLLLSSECIQYDVLDLSDAATYVGGDWDKIFNWHMRRNIERKKYENLEENIVKKCMEEYKKYKSTDIGKPTIAYLLCRSTKSLENPTSLFQDPKTFLQSEIMELINQKDYNSFVVLVYLMFHKGKVMLNKMDTKIIDDICSAYGLQVEHAGVLHTVNYDEVEVKGNVLSVRSNEVVRATFDFVWKNHKDLILRYCDDDLFLERITLTGSEEDLVQIAARFKSIIKAGKYNVEHHYLLENPRLKTLLATMTEA